jgi:hypothetical protein
VTCGDWGLKHEVLEIVSFIEDQVSFRGVLYFSREKVPQNSDFREDCQLVKSVVLERDTNIKQGLEYEK